VSWQLETDGYTVVEAADGRQALEALATVPELVVLDLSLPGLAGLDVLRRIRDGRTAAPPGLPVIVLSGRSGQTDRIVGLDQGADDYLVKPFSPGELAARVRSVLRRARPAEQVSPEASGEVVIDRATREVAVRGTPVSLTAKEFALLDFLSTHPRRVFSRAQLLRQVWDSSSSWQTEATVTEHVHRLRMKLEREPSRPRMLRTLRGMGYQFDPAPSAAFRP
jgi:DNA-binding response OmpR family regulator